MKVAVVGLGLFGRSLAVSLSRAGAEVIAIDSQMNLVDDVKDDVTLAVQLDATDERELRGQGIHEVDVLVACIGENFEANQLVVILARKLGIPRVISRTVTTTHSRILKLIGADETVLPEVEAAEEVARRLIQPSLRNYFELIEGYSVAEVEAPAPLHNRTLADAQLKQQYRVNLIAIKRKVDGKVTINAVPLGTDVILAGDVLAVAGNDQDIRALINR